MKNTKLLASENDKILSLTRFGALLTIATIAPLFGQQAVTGSMVNATLFIAAILLGFESAVLIGIVPSVISLAVGLLPAPLAPMVPFIVLSNAILVFIFSLFKDKNYWLGMVSAGVLKFLFLFGASSVSMNFIFKNEISSKIAVMMSWSQLFTALAGGLIAYLILKKWGKLN